MVRPVVPLSLALACAAFATPAFATDPDAQARQLEALEARVRELEQQIAALKAAQTPAPTATPVATPTPAPVATPTQAGFDDKKGVFVSSDFAGGSEVRLRMLLQGDGRHAFDDVTLDDTFLLRRAETTLEGNWGSWLGFRFTGEFAGANAIINDAYFDLKLDPRAGFRFGKSKTPLGLERLQSSSSNNLVENGFPSELAPGRDVGVQLTGKFESGLQYAFGVFNGAPDGRDAPTTNPDGDLELVGRAFFEPVKGMGFGIAASHGDKHGSGNDFLPRYRTPGQSTFFSYRSDVAADGTHLRISPQAYWYTGRFGALAEYIVSKQDVARSGASDTIDNRAWQISTSFALTGENVSYQGILAPNRAFSPGEGGWGAFEFVARYGRLDIDEDAFPLYADPLTAAAGARGWGFGVNWYLSPHFKLYADYVNTTFDVAPNGFRREDEDMLLTRAQFSF